MSIKDAELKRHILKISLTLLVWDRLQRWICSKLILLLHHLWEFTIRFLFN